MLDAETEIDFELVVLNVPPDVDAGPDASITSNDTFDFSGGFTDPGVIDSPWDWQIDWGDGTQDNGSILDQGMRLDRGDHEPRAARLPRGRVHEFPR